VGPSLVFLFYEVLFSFLANFENIRGWFVVFNCDTCVLIKNKMFFLCCI